MQPYFPGPKRLGFRVGSSPPESLKEHRRIAGWHRLWLELGRYLIAFEPLTFVLDQLRHTWQIAFVSSASCDDPRISTSNVAIRMPPPSPH
uniref:Putative rRNA intron-encoded homing endonuclease n=1 Tax=Triatoma infestans TaxID=30076 RepID=A0A161N061_TRIIF